MAWIQASYIFQSPTEILLQSDTAAPRRWRQPSGFNPPRRFSFSRTWGAWARPPQTARFNPPRRFSFSRTVVTEGRQTVAEKCFNPPRRFSFSRTRVRAQHRRHHLIVSIPHGDSPSVGPRGRLPHAEAVCVSIPHGDSPSVGPCAARAASRCTDGFNPPRRFSFSRTCTSAYTCVICVFQSPTEILLQSDFRQ